MEPRSIQVGDIVQITVNDQNYNIPIDRIDNYGIHAQKYTIIPVGNNWQVQNYNIPHSVSFFPGAIPEQKLSEPIRLVIAEGGGRSSEWFTDLEILSNNKAKILDHYRLFWDEYDTWPESNKEAVKSGLKGRIQEGEGPGRIATHYIVPNSLNGPGTLYEVVNPKHIFSYH